MATTPSSSSASLSIDQTIVLRRYRLILFLMGTLYPVWRFITYYIDPENSESWEQRALVGLLFLFIAFLTYTREHFRKHIGFYYGMAAYVLLTNVFYILLINNMSHSYLLLACITILVSGSVFLNHISMLSYYMVSAAAVGYLTVTHPYPIIINFFVGILLALSISYVCAKSLLSLMSQLQKSQQALARRTAEFEKLSAGVQSLFLPEQNSIIEKDFSLAGYYRPATACGGDWWSHYKRDENTLCVFVGDITGHGPDSAMMTASIASYMKALQTSRPDISMKELLIELNRHLRELQTDPKATHYLMTMLAMEIDLKGKSLKCYSAGTPFPIVIRQGEKPEFIGEAGSPLGLDLTPVIGFQEMALRPGDRIFLYTDGILEMKVANEKMLGDRRLGKLVAGMKPGEALEASKGLGDELDRLRTTEQEDDFTYVIIDVA